MDEIKLVPVHNGTLDTFPASNELPEGVKTLEFEDTYGYEIDFFPDVLYDERDGIKLHLQILKPHTHKKNARFPLVAFVQGSAWREQRIFQHLPALVRVCASGYVVAIIQYRHSAISAFPAQVEDAKTAIRFMRKNADKYGVLADRIALWGDSSGAHTALMAGITGDDKPDNSTYGDVSCAVRSIVDWYGPTDIAAMNEYPSAQDHTAPDSPEGKLIGGKNVLQNRELAEKTIPMNYLSAEKPTPPILIMHGSRDQLVPFNQSCRLYKKLRELGKEAEMYRLDGAYHGFGGFNSDGALEIVLKFLKRTLD